MELRMRTDTIARKIERPCSFDHFLNVLGHQPVLASPQILRGLRDQIGARQFGDFGAVLMAERPASADLSDRVARWREIERDSREDVPLRAHPDQTADNRRFQFAVAITAIVVLGWIAVGVAMAALSGRL
jgi:hypothetical protein